MKTQIITLESHDDLISVRDRMSWAKTPRILLVIPKFVKVTFRQVDLKILQRHASSLGAQLGMVTRTRRIRAEAEALGIPVFESTGQAQRVTWTRSKQRRLPHNTRSGPDKTLREKQEQVQVKEEAWRVLPVTRISALLLGVVSVLAIVALFIPRAQVKLNPVTQIQSIVLPVTANPAVDSVFITGSIPAREKQIVVEGAQNILVTGEGVVPQSKAKGVVIFRNITQNAVTIPAGTVVLGKDVRFTTMKEGALDAGVGKTVELPIEAMEGGVAGNLSAETINAIKGRLALSASVINPEPTTGGRERASVQATNSDRARAKDLLLKSLEKEARASLLDEMNSDDVFFAETLALTQILSENYDLPSGAAGSQLTLTMQAEFSIRYATASDLTELASLALNASLPSGFRAVSDAVTVKSATTPQLLDDGSLRWDVRAEREIVQSFDPIRITQLVLGLSKAKAQRNLEENLPKETHPVIQLSPSWWQWVPLLPFRIEVITSQPGG